MTLLSKASIIATPTAYGDSLLNSVKPTDGAGDFDFARASSATRVNEQGLIEKERENLLLQSNSFDTTWTTSSASVTSGQSGYDGSSDAWLLTATSTSNCRINQSISNSGVQTLSVYAKANTADFLAFNPIVVGTNPVAYFDLSNGTIGNTNSAVIDAKIVSVGSGWYRCSISFNDTNTQMRILVVDADGSTAVTSGNSIYIQDAQLEQGLVATDYIETTTSSVAVGITNDIPRINYENGIGNFLLEPQRTNVIESSEYLGDSSWIYTRATQSANEAISPEGVQNATLIANTTDTGAHESGTYLGNYTNASLAVSFYAKKKDNDYLQFGIYNSSTKWAAQKINLATGEILGSANTGFHNPPSGVSVTDVGNNWWRVEALFTTTLTGADETFYLSLTPTDATPTGSFGLYGGWTGATTENAYIYGVQVEQGSYPTSYIPTYGTSVTRVAETCNNAGNSDLFNDSEGVLYAEIAALDDELTFRHITISDGTTDNRINIRYTTTSNSISCLISGGGVTALNVSDLVADITDFTKVAIKYKSGDVAVWINGVETTTGAATFTITGLDTLSFDRGDGVGGFYGKTKMVSAFKEALSDSELECLTSWSSFNRMATAQNYTIQ
jgi:hypothetical protein